MPKSHRPYPRRSGSASSSWYGRGEPLRHWLGSSSPRPRDGGPVQPGVLGLLQDDGDGAEADAQALATSRWGRPRTHFWRRTSRTCRMDSRAVAIAPPSGSGCLDHPCVARFGPLPFEGSVGPYPVTDLLFRPGPHPSPHRAGVHDGPIRVFTMLRFRCSRWTDLSVHDRPKRAPS